MLTAQLQIEILEKVERQIKVLGRKRNDAAVELDGAQAFVEHIGLKTIKRVGFNKDTAPQQLVQPCHELHGPQRLDSIVVDAFVKGEGHIPFKVSARHHHDRALDAHLVSEHIHNIQARSLWHDPIDDDQIVLLPPHRLHEDIHIGKDLARIALQANGTFEQAQHGLIVIQYGNRDLRHGVVELFHPVIWIEAEKNFLACLLKRTH